jgi:hypothetical protein
MKKLLSTLVALCFGCLLHAQEFTALWHKAPADYTEIHGLPALQPERFNVFQAAEASLKDYLATAPQDPEQGRIIDLPTPEGGYRSFRFWSTPIMEEGLAKKYPGIRTYTAEATDNRQVTAKLDYTPFGFHAMIFDGPRTYLVDPYSRRADGGYIAYYKGDYSRPVSQRMSCEVDENMLPQAGAISMTGDGLPALRLNGTVRKTYRLALACTGDYAIAVDGLPPTKASVLAKMIISLNRVNGVYEREVAVTMRLVTNTDTLIFLDPSVDPYTNSSGSTMLGQNQATVDARIGTANYDIGHVFSTGGGGIAIKSSVCVANFKARGVTGSPVPLNDPFDIDFVAHEIGHQFGADHTFNANTGSCTGNGVPATAFEPGSGSTIMAYAGICGSGNDFKANSDAYFHSASLEQISAFITLPNIGGSCPSIITSTNANASLPTYTATYNIPFRTPFELTAPAAADATADLLTYCWEQRDLGDFQKSLAQTRLAGPQFRSFPPDTSMTRVFPALSALLPGYVPIGEKLPDTARSMHFRFTERDVYQGWGTFNFPDDVVTLNVTRTVGPFSVTYPVGYEVWTSGEQRTVTWNVSGTTAAPISAATVDIYMSVDGGYTYPYLIKSGTPNDGSETITVPNPPVTSYRARIKVKGTGNVFFNISFEDFTVLYANLNVPGSMDEQLKIAPVPARDILHIEIPPASGSLQARVVNTLGQAVWQGSLSGNASLPVSGWAAGIYHIQLYSAAGVQLTRKIVIQ